jgi:acid phosphatase (class A)
MEESMTVIRRERMGGRWLMFVCVLAAAGCAGRNDTLVGVPEIAPGYLAGYLKADAAPNSLALVPAPPAVGSLEMNVDEAYNRKALELRDTPAWTLAISDADLTFPHAANTFSCALRAKITEADTPHLYMLLHRTLADAVASTSSAKKQYQRARPFTVNNAPICTPGDRASLQNNGSYPSGHGAIGAAWALILAEISPAQTDAIVARGQAYAASRMICNVHWRSDTQQGRYMGAYTVARLHSDPTFERDLQAARKELEAVRTKSAAGANDCAAEAAAIALQQNLAP